MMHRTPLRRSDWLSAESRAEVSIARRSVGNFSMRLRGALNAVLKLRDGRTARRRSSPRRPAITAARPGIPAASIAELPLIVYVPEDAPHVRLEERFAGRAPSIACRDYDEAEAGAKAQLAEDRALGVALLAP